MAYWGVNMKSELLKDKRIINFLEHVEKMLYVEEQSESIKDELLDHIYCLVEDYKEAGCSKDKAIKKALHAMGDPTEIGYSFADFSLMKKRRMTLIILKASSGLMLMFLLGLAIYVSIKQDGISAGSDGSMISMLPTIMNMGNALLFGTGSTLALSHSTRLIDLDVTPKLILWSSKRRLPWEYIAFSLFFLPIVIIFFVLYFYEEGLSGNSLFAMWPLLGITYSAWAFFYSEKFRIPKYIVVDDGFIIKGRFISWTAISDYKWSNDYMSVNYEDYRLTLVSITNNNTNMPVKKNLLVNKRQKKYLDKIIYERVRCI